MDNALFIFDWKNLSRLAAFMEQHPGPTVDAIADWLALNPNLFPLPGKPAVEQIKEKILYDGGPMDPVLYPTIGLDGWSVSICAFPASNGWSILRDGNSQPFLAVRNEVWAKMLCEMINNRGSEPDRPAMNTSPKPGDPVLVHPNDLAEAQIVELSVQRDGRLWLNVDGVCLVRIKHVTTVTIDSHGIATKSAFEFPLPKPGERRTNSGEHFAGSERRMRNPPRPFRRPIDEE